MVHVVVPYQFARHPLSDSQLPNPEHRILAVE